GLDGLQGPLPELQNGLDVLVVGTAVPDELLGTVQQAALDLHGSVVLGAADPHGGSAGDVVADVADGADRVLQLEVTDRHPGFDHAQHQVGGPVAQQRSGGGHVRVPDDHVQPAVGGGVGVRLVAGV